MLDKKSVAIIRKILQTYILDKSYRAFIFGSRAAGNNRKFSDIDLGILATKSLSAKEYLAIKDKFEESDLPYKIEAIDFANVAKNFKVQALKKIINIWPKSLN